jgi:GT2 family glycosyltransferase
MYPEIETIQNETNLGYTGGNNVGIRRALDMGVKYVLLLNNDTIVDPELLNNLVDEIESDSSIGIAGPTVFDYYLQNSIQATGARVGWMSGRLKPVRVVPFGRFADVDLVSGCCLLARTEAVHEVGYLDEDYFAHWEEIDWCIRFKKAGYRVVWVQSAKIWHKGGATGSRISGFREYQNSRNRLWFMRKQAGTTHLASFFFYFLIFDFWFNILIHLHNGGLSGLGTFLRGTCDGLRAIPGSKNRLMPKMKTNNARHQKEG